MGPGGSTKAIDLVNAHNLKHTEKQGHTLNSGIPAGKFPPSKDATTLAHLKKENI